MPQIFHRSSNVVAKMTIISAVALVVLFASGATLYFWSPYVTGQGENIAQPVQFTHEHHVAGLGIDCRYCHWSVETSSFAGIPPTKVCMGCHTQLWSEEEILEPIRTSWSSGVPIKWRRVHNLADFAYFNHAIHIAKGIGCAECHGRVDQMPLMYQASTLHMRWCLECHSQPEKFVRPREEVFNSAYEHPPNQEELGRKLVEEYHIQSKMSCNNCHR